MDTTWRKEYLLENLGCANCAAKMEEQINKLGEIKNVSVNFVTKTLFIEVLATKAESQLIEEINQIVTRIEPDVVVYDKNSLEQRRSAEKQKNTKKLTLKSLDQEIIKIALAIAIFAVALIFPFYSLIELSLFVLSYIIAGHKVLLRAVRNIFRGQLFDENFLMTLATLGAFAIGEYPEAVAVMLFYLIGEYFQDLAVDRSRKSITDLLKIKSDYANLATEKEIIKVIPESVKRGDTIIVKPGEKIPLDGEIISGSSTVDTSNITGEAVPRGVKSGDTVLSGFVNNYGLLTVRVTKEYKESTVARILDLVQNASSKKAPTENFITKFAKYYTPFIVVFALLVAFIPPLLFADASLADWVYRALIFLVISCPCALVISIPLGFFGGIGAASKNGILIKGGNYLEALNYVDTIVFDKTGTLTEGVFKVTQKTPAAGFSEQELLKYAVAAETYSNHPIAKSILQAYEGEIVRDKVESFQEIAGQGIKVKIANEEILVGNNKLMLNENIKYLEPIATGTVVHVAVNQQYVGFLVISDQVKLDSRPAITALKKLGIKQNVMLTGDKKEIGTKIAAELGIDQVLTELLPHQKVEKLEKLLQEKSTKSKIAFVGDGINDTPALARADIGIAMGGLGSDAVIELADIVLMTDEPTKIVSAIKIAKQTKRVVWQNIFFAFGVKLIILLFGVFGLATMWEAVFADVGVALLAVLNAMRVLNANYSVE